MFSRSQFPKPPHGPEGRRAYVIGDIHGRLDLLDRLLDDVHAEIDRERPGKVMLVFLGDLIDRGPQSAGVVERLRTYRHRAVRPIFLLGNHEEVLLRILGGELEHLAGWLRFGGAQCLKSYGADPRAIAASGDEAALAAIRAAIPDTHIEFLRTFVDTCRFGDYLFVHAGIQPGVAIDKQRQQDMRWIREPFLSDQTDHGFVVVHGHTISPEVEERANRIGIDTGAYRSGVLTALAIEGAERWFLNTGAVVGTPLQATH